MMETFEAGQALEMYNKEKISLIYGVPTMFVLMLEHPNFAKTDFSSSGRVIPAGPSSPKSSCPVFAQDELQACVRLRPERVRGLLDE
jgi:acyl-CoA synthetase (AMP-forming)/AMP-acid ligase II